MAPCPPKARSADLSPCTNALTDRMIIAVYNRHAAASESLLRESRRLSQCGERRIVSAMPNAPFERDIPLSIQLLTSSLALCSVYDLRLRDIRELYTLTQSETEMTWFNNYCLYFRIELFILLF